MLSHPSPDVVRGREIGYFCVLTLWALDAAFRGSLLIGQVLLWGMEELTAPQWC